MKFHIITFGCQMNVGDSDWLSRSLMVKGWTPSTEDEADIVILNTCSVREKPEVKVYSQLGRLAGHWRKNRDFFVAVGGCVAQQVGTALWKRFPFVRLVFGTDGLAMVPQTLERLVHQPRMRSSLLDFMDDYPERDAAWPQDKLPAQAYVTIMQGCDNYCAYCIVPYVRGRQKSRNSAEVLRECRDLVNRGVREITLLGQNVNSYSLDRHGDDLSFAQLLHQVAAIPRLSRLKFTTSHPKDLAPEVIDAFGQLSVLCPQLHLPMQSGSDRILSAMGRKYNRQDYLDKVMALRNIRPNISLTTDLIVGFPGETEADFEDTLDMIRLVGFENSYSFKYCDRPGVRAALLPNPVDEEVKTERLARLQRLQDELTLEAYERLVGSEVEILVEGLNQKESASGRQWHGRDASGRVVNFVFDGLDELGELTDRFVRARIRKANKHSLVGEVMGTPW